MRWSTQHKGPRVTQDKHEDRAGTWTEVFLAFLKLGLTSFGGPVAHIGYFREEFVIRRRWLDDHAYADLVALCQFLPGPASSQVGFSLGLMRAGWLGALAAFAAFTLPSAIVLVLFALTAAQITGPVGIGALDGLKIVAVAIVAQAVWGMARNLCPDKERATIALLAIATLAILPGALGMVAAIGIGALSGLALGRGVTTTTGLPVTMPVSPQIAVVALLLCATLLLVLPLIAAQSQGLAVLDGFFRAGALVFGGGHVVLPLLQAETVAAGWVTQEQFLAGYGAAQAVPGPLFTFAAFLGTLVQPGPNGLTGAMLAMCALFLPGFLVLIGILPFWDRFRRIKAAQSLMQGANAAVVGILGAALYDPVFTSAVHDMRDFTLALACFLLLMLWKLPSLGVVIFATCGGIALALLA